MEKKDRNHNSYCELPKNSDSSLVKTGKREGLAKGKENQELRILRKGRNIKERICPDRFSGEGVNFRAKIIGTEHVFDARGNRMCQGSLQRLKAAVKTSGDHKQKIILNISLDGIIIKDEKSRELLHHHPIHKISFISQDTKDNRAFGYVYGCPQAGHSFFAIKTEKVASQVVVTLRDLFLVALEMKKSELESTQNSEQSKVDVELNNADEINNGKDHEKDIMILREEAEELDSVEGPSANHTLLDLQSDVDILQQGISQMDHSIAVSQSFGILLSEDEFVPAAFQSKTDKLSLRYQETLSVSSRSSSTSDNNAGASEGSDISKKDLFINESCPLEASMSLRSTCNTSLVSEEAYCSQNGSSVEDKYAVFLDIDLIPSIFDDLTIVPVPSEEAKFPTPKSSSAIEEEGEVVSEVKSIALAEDPLVNQSCIYKRDFLQDINNLPKKVLLVSVISDIFHPLETDSQTVLQENLVFPDLKLGNEDNVFTCEGEDLPTAIRNPPKPPPKRLIGITPPDVDSIFSHTILKESKNPFHCIPPPCSSPPPPPRIQSQLSESAVPPRPPSRITGVLTPPLPKRKVPFNSSNRPWFSFDQDATTFISETDSSANTAPPLPSPARKLPPTKSELILLKSSSASNSPATIRRLYNKSPHLGCSFVLNEMNDFQKVAPLNCSLMKGLSMVQGLSSSNACTESPLTAEGPKAVLTSQLRSSTLTRGLSVSSYSGSNESGIKSFNGTHSSLELYCPDDHGIGSEALFFDSTESNFDCFPQSNKETIQPQSSNDLALEKDKNNVSPDSIFRRKSDPFADDFFLSLSKKSMCDSATKCSNNFNHFDNLEEPM